MNEFTKSVTGAASVGVALILPASNTAAGDELAPAVVTAAREIAARPIVRRVNRLADLPKDFLVFQGMLAQLTPQRREVFGLSMGDMLMGDGLARELPLLATGAATSGDPQLVQRACDQLRELATWRPLQRPGWTLFAPGAEPGADFNDGGWLGTGVSIRAIVTTLAILGERIPPPLRADLHALLEREVVSVRDDFATHRSWFWDTPVSNQFVLPNTGVLLACVELGRDRHAADYEFAVGNLRRSIRAQGVDGASHEGAHYGAYMTHEILAAALAAATTGDRRLIEDPHLANFGRWALHLLQPGGSLVHFFDGCNRGLQDLQVEPWRMTTGRNLAACLYLSALAGREPQVEWILRHVLKPVRPVAEQWQYAQRAAVVPAEQPPTFAAFTSSPLVTWRSSWADDATGLWIRGGSEKDSHQHCDYGHLNYIIGGREILIEAGSTKYDDPNYNRDYAFDSAHNSLHVGPESDGTGWQLPPARHAPIAVARLDAQGGEVTVDSSAAYEAFGLQAWQRQVVWDVATLAIRDAIQFQPGRLDTCRLYFHLGSEAEVHVEPSDGGKTALVTWRGGRIRFAADVPIAVEARVAPHGITWESKAQHTCLVVSPVAPAPVWTLRTQLAAADFAPVAGVRPRGGTGRATGQ